MSNGESHKGPAIGSSWGAGAQAVRSRRPGVCLPPGGYRRRQWRRCIPRAHALPSAPFWFPVPAVLVASPALLCPSSLSAVLALVPLGVAPAFCVSVLLLPLSVGAPGCPCAHPLLSHLPTPPVRGFHISVRRGLSRAWLAGHSPIATPVAGPCALGATPALVEYVGTLSREGGGCLLMARSALLQPFGGCSSARTSWFPCVLWCVLLGLVSLPCVPPPPAPPGQTKRGRGRDGHPERGGGLGSPRRIAPPPPQGSEQIADRASANPPENP